MSESLEEVSDRIIRGHTNSEGQWVTSPSLVKESILSALRNERERCAKVAETHRCELGAPCAEAIARAIREGR